MGIAMPSGGVKQHHHDHQSSTQKTHKKKVVSQAHHIVSIGYALPLPCPQQQATKSIKTVQNS